MRNRIGIWLLRPALLRELTLVMDRHNAKYADAKLERYWMGRITAIRRVLANDLFDD